jgi:hypothetical protein
LQVLFGNGSRKARTFFVKAVLRVLCIFYTIILSSHLPLVVRFFRYRTSIVSSVFRICMCSFGAPGSVIICTGLDFCIKKQCNCLMTYINIPAVRIISKNLSYYFVGTLKATEEKSRKLVLRIPVSGSVSKRHRSGSSSGSTSGSVN